MGQGSDIRQPDSSLSMRGRFGKWTVLDSVFLHLSFSRCSREDCGECCEYRLRLSDASIVYGCRLAVELLRRGSIPTTEAHFTVFGDGHENTPLGQTPPQTSLPVMQNVDQFIETIPSLLNQDIMALKVELKSSLEAARDV